MLDCVLAVVENVNTSFQGIPDWAISLINVVAGFILGLIGASYSEWRKTCKRKKCFNAVVCSELKQLLSHSLTDMIHPDADLTEKKFKLLYEVHIRYQLSKEVYMFADNIDVAKVFADADWAASMFKAIKSRRKASGNMMVIGKMTCNFIYNHLETISLLEKHVASRFINLIHRIESRNHVANGINDAYQKSFNQANPSNAIAQNYYTSCQQLSDMAPSLTRDIILLIELLDTAESKPQFQSTS